MRILGDFRWVFTDNGDTTVRGGIIVVVAAMALVACAGNPEDESILAKNDAIDDFIEVAQLKAIEKIRYRRGLRHELITKDYVIIYDGPDPYLVAFVGPCHELKEGKITPDYRHEARILRARSETYRGCRIRNLYEITPGQATELLAIGTKSYQ